MISNEEDECEKLHIGKIVRRDERVTKVHGPEIHKIFI